MNNSIKELNTGEVWRESFGILWHKPIVLLPILIVLMFELLLGLLTRFFIVLPERITSIKDLMSVLPSLLPAMFISFVLVYIIAYPIFEGMYPLLVKNIMENKEIELKTAFMSAVRKAPVLIAAGILLTLIILAGFLFFIIPGVIFCIWYFYTIPVIMLENRGVIDAMKVSKAFASDKKFKTLLYFLLPFSIWIFTEFFVRLITAALLVNFFSIDAMNNILPLIAMLRKAIDIVISMIFYSWLSVIPAYVYIKSETGSLNFSGKG